MKDFINLIFINNLTSALMALLSIENVHERIPSTQNNHAEAYSWLIDDNL